MFDVRVFISYAHEDSEYREELEKHLKIFERNGLIECWHDREILPASRWENDINQHLRNADIIIALVSSSFIASDYCYEKELQEALKQNESGRSHLIPIIVRPVAWETSPLGKLQALPTDGKPVSTWDNKDKAWKNVTAGIQKVIQSVKKQKQAIWDALPDILRRYHEERLDLLVEDDDSTVNRNIARLQNKQPEIWKAVQELRQEVRAYCQSLLELYKMIYESVFTPFLAALIGIPLTELFEQQFKCLLKELGIVEKLEKSKLKPSLFGFSDSKTLQEYIRKNSEGYVETAKSLAGALKFFRQNVLDPVRRVGEEAEGEEFEDIED
jgi:hypothetical protein